MYLLNVAFLSIEGYAQSGFTVSVPIIYSKVEVANNWSPSTAINRKNQFDGNALGYGVNVSYSFQPNFIIKNKNILISTGLGYFKQRFNVVRPFDYNSPLRPIFYTDNYAYSGLQWNLGLSYCYTVKEKYFLKFNLSYLWMRALKQEYTPTSNYGYGQLTQVNYFHMDFGNLLLLTIGLNRNLGDKFAVGVNMLTPVYTRWRNDKIFKDDPLLFFHPKFSLGLSVSATYKIKHQSKIIKP